uniref:Jacalin-type lectin domain-containing protein n=1 Tax=Globodera pallida TaxID=36090 RepID=A0A183CLL4_GLOPA
MTTKQGVSGVDWYSFSGPNVRRLRQHNELQFYDVDRTLLLCVAGDYGGNYMKIGIIIGNVSRSESAEKFTLLGSFKGDETIVNLRVAFGKLATAINRIKEVDEHGRFLQDEAEFRQHMLSHWQTMQGTLPRYTRT